jgi:hypothetical protein
MNYSAGEEKLQAARPRFSCIIDFTMRWLIPCTPFAISFTAPKSAWLGQAWNIVGQHCYQPPMHLH